MEPFQLKEEESPKAYQDKTRDDLKDATSVSDGTVRLSRVLSQSQIGAQKIKYAPSSGAVFVGDLRNLSEEK